jgi:tetratricopeptide (TPR) repeat protein
MNKNRSDDSSSRPRRPDPESWGYSPGYFGNERVTVDSLQKSRSSRRHRRGRRSSRKHHSEDGESNKKVWVFVGLAAFVYLAIMAVFLIVPKLKSPAAGGGDDVAAEVAMPEQTDDSAVPASSPASSGEAETIISAAKKSMSLADEGRFLLRARKFAEAEKKFAAASEWYPHAYAILNDWAQALIEQQKWEEARDVLVRIVQSQPDSVNARISLSMVYERLKRSDDARMMAEWVLEKEPYSEPALQILAESFSANDNHQRSVDYWKKLFMLNSNNRTAEKKLGTAYLKLGQYDQAIKTFENIIRNDPASSEAHYYLTICVAAQGRTDAAIDLLSTSVDKFGLEFVRAWTKAPELESLRGLDAFSRIFGATGVDATQPAED